MARINQTTTTKKVDKEENVSGTNLTYTYEIADGKIVQLSASGIKKEGSGNCFFQWQRGVAIPNTSFNQMAADAALQTHVQDEFAAIVAEVEPVG